MIKNKRQKAEDFIGWKSPDGKLEVIGIAGKQGRTTTFKVSCTECSKDKELFPDGYFVSRKGNLVRGIKPCGCGKNVRWKDWQFLILATRAVKDRFVVHGFSEEFKGAHTKLNLECLKDGHRWTASIDNIVNNGKGCPKCKGTNSSEKQRTPEYLALQKCIDICKEVDYDVVGFPDGYKNNTSRFEYICKIHGKQNVSYNNFVGRESRCPECGVEQQKTPEQEALQKCIDICKENNYNAIGFPSGYKNSYSRFEYVCKIHGKQNVSYSNFINNGSRCIGCWKDKLKELGNGNGYYPERKDEQDYLYVLNFNNKFIKVGRSFDVNERIKKLKQQSKIKKIYKLRIFTATHKEIYDYEQELHSELRERNFQHYVDWSTECFENDCQFILNKFLDSNLVAGNFEEISY